MFQYAKSEIERQLDEKLDKQEELEQIQAKKKMLHELLKESKENIEATSILIGTIVFGIGIVGIGSELVLTILKHSLDAASMLLLCGAFSIVFVIPGISTIRKEKKRCKTLREEISKLNGKKGFHLEDEYAKVETEIFNLNQLLNWIEQTESMQNIGYQTRPFFQADSKQQYEDLIKNREYCKQLLDQYLTEKIDYSKVHLKNPELEEVYVKRLIKK